jgi:hypothetical protein
LAQQRQLDLQRGSGDPDELHWRRCQWGHVEEQAREPAMNEEHGWTVLSDGSYGKTLPNGQVLSCWGGVSYEEDDGTVVDTSKHDERWLKRHRAICHHCATRTRAERLEKVRSRTRPTPQRRAREHRPGKSRRASSSSRTSSTDPGDPDGEPAGLL